ncbi:MAG: hypothetical protein RL147_740 [Actinomycetota bacterium]|jgi:hypothetical protein
MGWRRTSAQANDRSRSYRGLSWLKKCGEPSRFDFIRPLRSRVWQKEKNLEAHLSRLVTPSPD